MNNSYWLAAASRCCFAQGTKSEQWGIALSRTLTSLRTVVQICILTAAMFTAPAVAALKHWQQQQKRSDIPLAGPRSPSPAPTFHGIRGAIRSRFEPTRFHVYRSRVLRSALIIGLVIFNARAPECQAGSVPFVCMEHHPLEVLIRHSAHSFRGGGSGERA